MRMFSAGAVLLALLALSLSACERRPEVLARIGDTEITVEDFREAFARLTPAEQVEVLEPGGRMALLDKIMTKTILGLSLASSDTSGASFWVRLYEDEWLSRNWREELAASMGDTSTVDPVELSRQVRLRIVLLPDSAGAASLAAAWSAGDYSPPAVTSLAPWSAGGSSYRVLEGPAFGLSPELADEMLPRADSGPAAFPVYDAWAVAELELGGPSPDSLPASAAAFLVFDADLRRQSAVAPSSPAIETVSAMMAPGPDGLYTLPDLSGRPEESTILVRWDGGSLTAGEVSSLIRAVRPAAFFGSVPPELQAVAAPAPGPEGPGVDLWFYLTGVARQRWEAGGARGAGLDPDSSDVAEMAAVEHMLRRRVLEGTPPPDSAAVTDFYERNRGSLVLPERRTVLLAYVPAETADSIGPVDSFDAVERWAPRAEDGSPLPTPPQVPEAFGALAEAVFAAPEGTVTGPVATSRTDLAAYFEVLSVMPPDTAAPGDVWPLLERYARAEAIVEAYGAYIEELRAGFSVEIDSSAVEAVDPWSGTY